MIANAVAVGIDRLVEDLRELGYTTVDVIRATTFPYAVITGFTIPAGTFAGQVIDLAIPATADYPRSLPSSMHIRATPHLVPFGSIMLGGVSKRNVIASADLGDAWQYWSYQFKARPSNPTAELMSQINECFRTN
jgi:hypothetical protein